LTDAEKEAAMTARFLLVLLPAFALCLLGCNKPSEALPKTYPVTGTVVYKDGKPVAGGSVFFRSVTDSSFGASGDIDKDGKFSLSTVKGNEKLRGAPEGEYWVTVQPPIPPDQRAAPAIDLPHTFKVEAKDNQFTIEVEARR
jgi:hypothetical protein